MPNRRTIPTPQNPDLITLTIKSEGVAIPDEFQILSVSVNKEVNRISSARIILSDGDAANGDFPASNADMYIPGKKIEIKAGYHSSEKTIFKGMTVRQSLRIREGGSRLIIDCRDEAFKMTIVRKSRYFEESTDSDVFESILEDYPLEKDVEATQTQHLELVQYNATDWDFIVSRADANGQLCFTDDGKMTIQKPDLEEAAAVSVEYGSTIIELDAEMDGRLQYEGVKAKNWDLANQEVQEVEANEPSHVGPGNITAANLARSLGQPALEMQHTGNIKQEELQAWADAKLQRSRLAKIRGRVRFQGFADIKPGLMIELQSIGERFSGNAFVSGIQHQISEGNWTTDVQFGLDEKWFAQEAEIPAPPASLLFPAVSGLQIGVVSVLEGDPEGEDRIKVRLPMVSPQNEGTWARLACLDAGDSRGMFFRPEMGDEVVVGFLNDDPRDAIVLGSLHSSAKPTPEQITDDNFRKGFISRSELKVILDDENKSILLMTPNGNKLTLDDDEGAFTLADENGNKITMDSSGIKIESDKAIEISAAQDLKAEGMNVNISAQLGLKAEGSASAELSASGSTTVKGSIVQIN